MIFDLILFGGGGAVLGVLAHIFFLELKATGKLKPALTATEAQIEGFGQIMSADTQALMARFDAWEQAHLPNIEALGKEVEQRMSQAGDALVAKLQQVAAEVDAKIAAAAQPAQAQLAAEQADHQADLANVGQAVDALAAKVA